MHTSRLCYSSADGSRPLICRPSSAEGQNCMDNCAISSFCTTTSSCRCYNGSGQTTDDDVQMFIKNNRGGQSMLLHYHPAKPIYTNLWSSRYTCMQTTTDLAWAGSALCLISPTEVNSSRYIQNKLIKLAHATYHEYYMCTC